MYDHTGSTHLANEQVQKKRRNHSGLDHSSIEQEWCTLQRVPLYLPIIEAFAAERLSQNIRQRPDWPISMGLKDNFG